LKEEEEEGPTRKYWNEDKLAPEERVASTLQHISDEDDPIYSLSQTVVSTLIGITVHPGQPTHV
jgi:hypothetical protein